MTDLSTITVDVDIDYEVWTFPSLGRAVAVGTATSSLWDGERLFVHSIEEM